jgi:hypothetical protein
MQFLESNKNREKACNLLRRKTELTKRFPSRTDEQSKRDEQAALFIENEVIPLIAKDTESSVIEAYNKIFELTSKERGEYFIQGYFKIQMPIVRLYAFGKNISEKEALNILGPQ